MPDFSSTADLVVEQYLPSDALAPHVDAVWRIVRTVGAGLVVVMSVAAVILCACWFLEYWRRKPLPPTSIIPEQPDGRRQYTGPKRR